MILRRIINNLKEQNWFTVLIELIVVIAGIFLGLQATNWQESLNEQETAQKYLYRLKSDLQDDVKVMEDSLIFWETVSDFSKQSLLYLEMPEQVKNTNWELILGFFQASQIAPFESNDITYNELQQAGELSLIDNHELRQDLAVYYSFNSSLAANSIMQHIPEYRSLIRGLIPSYVISYIWENCFDTSNLKNQKIIPCQSPLNEAELDASLLEIKTSTQLLPALRFWYSTQTSTLQFIPHNIAKAKKLIAEVESELSRIE